MEILSGHSRTALVGKGGACGRGRVGDEESDVLRIPGEVAGGQLGELIVGELRRNADQNTWIGLSQFIHQQNINLGRLEEQGCG